MPGLGLCKSCCPKCGPLCVTLTGNGNLNGVVVTVKYQRIISVTITNGGTYVTPPGVAFSTTNGSGGTGTTTLTNGKITGVIITNGGAYAGPVTVSFPGGGGAGGQGTVNLSGDLTAGTCSINGQVTSVARNLVGAGYTAIPPVNFSGGGGSGATAVATMGVTNTAAISIANGGSGYAVGNVLFVVGGTQTSVCRIQVASVGAGGAITGVTLVLGGTYSVLPANPVATTVSGGGPGVDATFNLTWGVSAVTLTNGGSGYTSIPTVTIPGGTTNATATATFAYRCCIDAPTAGRYKVSTDACTPASTNVNVTCPAGGGVTISAQGSVSFPVTLCPTPCNQSRLLSTFFTPHTWNMTGMGLVNNHPSLQGGVNQTCVLLVNFSRFGTYQIEGPIGPCYESGTKSVTISQCSGLQGTTFSPVSKKYKRIWFVKGCSSMPLQGATVTLSGKDYGQSQTSDENGKVTFSGIPADCLITLTATYPRFVSPAPFDFAGECVDWDESSAQTIQFNTPLPDYICTKCLPYPIPKTLHGTCSEGAVTLIYGAGNYYVGCTEISGKQVACVAANCGCERDSEKPPDFPTKLMDGPSAVALVFNPFIEGWNAGDPGACGAAAVVLGCGNQAAVGENAYPLAACCADYGGGRKYISHYRMLGCVAVGANECVTPATGLTPGCGGSTSGPRVGNYPATPPFSGTWQIVDFYLPFPSGTITIME